LFGFLPFIELSLEIENIKQGPVKPLQYYTAFFESLAWQLKEVGTEKKDASSDWRATIGKTKGYLLFLAD